MSSLEIYWEPDPAVFADAIMAVEGALEKTEIPLLLASREVREDIMERFITHTGPDGQQWPEWADSYADVALSYPNIDLLRRNDTLFQYLQSDDAWIVNGDTLFFESGGMPDYGEMHQTGTRKMPARPFLGISEKTRSFIFATFGEWFQRSIELYETTLHRLGRRHALRGPTGQFIPRATPISFRRR